MRIALEDARRERQLAREPARPWLEQAGELAFEVAPGEVVRVASEDSCLLANVFYLLAGVGQLDGGVVRLDGDAQQGPPRARGIELIDRRSALWWSASVLDNVAAATADEADPAAAARAWLDRLGAAEPLARLVPGWKRKLRRAPREERALLEAAIADPYQARPARVPRELHKRLELARALAARPRLLLWLDSCDCAGQPDGGELYDELIALAAEAQIPVLLFSRLAADPGFARQLLLTREGETGLSLAEQDWALPEEPEAEDVVLRLEGLAKAYTPGKTVIEDVSFCVGRGKTMVVMGGSGCGKSTLLRLVAGLQPVTEGEVWYDPLDEHRKPTGLRKIIGVGEEPAVGTRTQFGVLFQYSALFNSMTVAQNVASPIREHTSLHPNVVANMVEIKLKQVSMWGDDPEQSEHAHKLPSELSGGQQKRIGLARALALDPQVMFYDEPSAGLDPIVSRQIDELMVDLGLVYNVTSIVITHELDSAFTIADQIVVLRKADERENEYWGPARMMAMGDKEQIKGCVDPHVIDFLHDFSYHHKTPLASVQNWYADVFGLPF